MTVPLSRVDYLAKLDTFITLKDHKENFNANPKCRLINSSKSDLGEITNFFIENINENIYRYCNKLV